MKPNILVLLLIAPLLGVFSQDSEIEKTSEITENQRNAPDITDRLSHHHHHHEDPTFKGFWKKKFVWRPRWVKTWQAKKIYVAVWKRMWGPVELKEWVPIPKPPPGWLKPTTSVGTVFVKKIPH